MDHDKHLRMIRTTRTRPGFGHGAAVPVSSPLLPRCRAQRTTKARATTPTNVTDIRDRLVSESMTAVEIAQTFWARRQRAVRLSRDERKAARKAAKGAA